MGQDHSKERGPDAPLGIKNAAATRMRPGNSCGGPDAPLGINAARMRRVARGRMGITDKYKTYRIATLGCKVNQQESEAIAASFEALGFSPAGKGEEADVCVINSCTVTSMADSKTRQKLRQARAANPGALLCLIGCLPEAAGGQPPGVPEADLVVGNADKERTAELAAALLAERAEAGTRRNTEAGRGRRGPRYRPGGQRGRGVRGQSLGPDGQLGRGVQGPDGAEGTRTRAFLKAQDGCDRFCAFCIIPYARGPVRSRPADELQREAEGLLAAGYKELVLTGINLALYGRDLAPGESLQNTQAPGVTGEVQVAGSMPAPGVTAGARSAATDRIERDALYGRDFSPGEGGGLYGLVKRLGSIEAGGEYRIRLGSLEPTAVDARQAVRIASTPGVCPQLHLSLQSGSARTLEAMGRPYTPDGYEGIVKALRGLDPLFSVTTDVIVGFPGETEQEFEESLDFVRRMGFARVHVFKYSKRPGTRAALMDNQVREEVKNERRRRMIEIADNSAARFVEQNEGRPRRVLIYGPDRDRRFVRGLSDNGIDIFLPYENAARYLSNEYYDIKIIRK